MPRKRRLPVLDAADPFADDRGHTKRKLRQLCRQVERVLITALADREEALVRALGLVEVLPWPNASRLLVVVAPEAENEEIPRLADGVIDRSALLSALDEVKEDLRELVMHAVHRKRAPELCFEVMGSLEDPFSADLGAAGGAGSRAAADDGGGIAHHETAVDGREGGEVLDDAHQ